MRCLSHIMLILIFCMNAFCVNAKDYFVDGQKAFDAGNYAEAINNFITVR